MSVKKQPTRNRSRSDGFGRNTACPLVLALLFIISFCGCRFANNQLITFESPTDIGSHSSYVDMMDQPAVDQASFESAEDALSLRPYTLSDFEKAEFNDLTLEETIQLVLSNTQILSKLGGQVITAPQAAVSIYDPAIQKSNPLNGEEGALSAFDARWDTTFNFFRSERKFNNAFFGGGATQLISNTSAFNSALTKTTPFGSTYGVRQIIDYSRNNSPVNRFASVYDMVWQAEFRQSILQGAGTLVNQVAGPNSAPGVYNGVRIARISQNITQADFEASIRDLIREVERSYWELYFAYRNLQNLMQSRDAAHDIYNKRNKRKGLVDNKSLVSASQFAYFNFQAQVENALVGTSGTTGVLSAERELRRLCGLNAVDGRLLRPISEPTIAPYTFVWDDLQVEAMERRVELRRQQWTIKQRELEYLAAQNLNRWRLDFVANYGWRGFGDNLAGSTSRPEGSALEDLWSGDLDDWNMGFEFGGAIGKRQTQLAIQNAEVQLSKARAILREQQRQIVINLSRSFSEVDRAFTNINSRDLARRAVEEEVYGKTLRDEVDDKFAAPEAQQRAADARTAFIRSVVDYNRALLDIAYESGKLLERYNIQLAEGAVPVGQ